MIEKDDSRFDQLDLKTTKVTDVSLRFVQHAAQHLHYNKGMLRPQQENCFENGGEPPRKGVFQESEDGLMLRNFDYSIREIFAIPARVLLLTFVARWIHGGRPDLDRLFIND